MLIFTYEDEYSSRCNRFQWPILPLVLGDADLQRRRQFAFGCIASHNTTCTHAVARARWQDGFPRDQARFVPNARNGRLAMSTIGAKIAPVSPKSTCHLRDDVDDRARSKHVSRVATVPVLWYVRRGKIEHDTRINWS